MGMGKDSEMVAHESCLMNYAKAKGKRKAKVVVKVTGEKLS